MPLVMIPLDLRSSRSAMSTQPHSVKLTYEDYVLFPDDGKRHEIIEGNHYVTPAPRTKHQKISGNLLVALASFLKQHPFGVVLTAPCDVVLSDENVIQPDLLFVSAARAAIVTEDNIQGAPDLIIEIISEASRKRDEVTKRKLYERFRVQEYWLVEPDLQTVKIFTREKEAYAPPQELSVATNDVLMTLLLPGFQLSLAEIFA